MGRRRHERHGASVGTGRGTLWVSRPPWLPAVTMPCPPRRFPTDVPASPVSPSSSRRAAQCTPRRCTGGRSIIGRGGDHRSGRGYVRKGRRAGRRHGGRGGRSVGRRQTDGRPSVPRPVPTGLSRAEITSGQPDGRVGRSRRTSRTVARLTDRRPRRPCRPLRIRASRRGITGSENRGTVGTMGGPGADTVREGLVHQESRDRLPLPVVTALPVTALVPCHWPVIRAKAALDDRFFGILEPSRGMCHRCTR